MASRKTILEIINENSLKLYYLLKMEKIKTSDLYQIIKTKDRELILSKLKLVSKKSFDELKDDYTKEDCLDEILYLTDNRYRHLKEIRDIVDLNNVIDTVVTEEVYIKKVNIHYTDLILDSILDDFYDYPNIQLLSKCKMELIDLDDKINRKLMGNIDRFYIQKITI